MLALWWERDRRPAEEKQDVRNESQMLKSWMYAAVNECTSSLFAIFTVSLRACYALKFSQLSGESSVTWTYFWSRAGHQQTNDGELEDHGLTRTSRSRNAYILIGFESLEFEKRREKIQRKRGLEQRSTKVYEPSPRLCSEQRWKLGTGTCYGTDPLSNCMKGEIC